MLKTLFNVLDFGACPQGKAFSSPAINAALEGCHAHGGGRVLVPAGEYLCGPLQLRSGVELHLEAGATVRFSRNFQDFPLHFTTYEGTRTVRCQSPLWGHQLEAVALTGAGTFDGQGDAWRPVKKFKLPAEMWERICAAGGVVDREHGVWWPSHQAMQGEALVRQLHSSGQEPRLEDYREARDFLRPNLVQLIGCRDVLLDGLTFANSPAWNIHLLDCEDVQVSRLNVLNPWYAQNGDGLDVESCRNVRITWCTLDVGDDAICLKSGKDAEGRKRGKPSENIHVSHCTVKHGHGGLVVGSEMSGGVRNVEVSHCHFSGTDVGLRFKSCRGRGGTVQDIRIQDVTMEGILGAAISLDMYYGGTAWGEGIPASPTWAPIGDGTPVFQDISVSRVQCQGARVALEVKGLPEMPLKNLYIADFAASSEYGAELNFIDGLVLENVDLQVQHLPALEVREVRGLSTRNLSTRCTPGPEENGAAAPIEE